MYYGFVSGVGLTSITAASMYYVRTATKVDANEILLAARKSLNSSEDLRSLLGGYIYVGELAGFRHTYGSFKISGFRPKWKAPKIEMIFNVYSGKNEGEELYDLFNHTCSYMTRPVEMIQVLPRYQLPRTDCMEILTS